MVTPFFQKVIVSLVTLIFLGYVGYGLFTQTVEVPVDSQDASTIGGASSQDILILVEKMEKVSFDNSMFSSVLFTSLIDYSFPTTPELKGRPNPFAPIGVDQVVTTQVTVTNSSKVKATP